jgi:NitT/TauT family transport system ATP-binding protein
MDNSEKVKIKLLQAEDISKWYGDGHARKVILDNLNLTINEGEFVSLLGPSGSGKSTFLRIMAGLIPPSSGQVIVKGNLLTQTNPYVAIVFQNFALYPWLNVKQNVALGLISKDISKSEKEKRVNEAIHLIGLHGFESAYPKEISGGMKQRVGFARALVVQPEILMLDEPFSALDVLTAENLRHELLTLWLERKIPTKSILMVTHNIDEAVCLADRMLILSSDPGRFRVDIKGLPSDTRAEKDTAHLELVDNIYQVMTNPHANPSKVLHNVKYIDIVQDESPYQVIPQINLGVIKGFAKRLLANGGKENLHALHNIFTVDQMLPIATLIDMLDFGGIEAEKIVLTDIGKAFAKASPEKAKQILRKQMIENIALLQFIMKQIQESSHHEISKAAVLKHLEQYFAPQDALLQLKTVIGMGLYSELLTYNHGTGRITLNKQLATV